MMSVEVKPMSTTILRMQGVNRQFTGGTVVQALADINLEIEQGEFVLVLGPSGSGKTTLLSVMGGLDRPTDGEIYLDNQAVHRLSENRLSLLRRKKVGFVFQFFNLLANLTALDNVALPLRMNGLSARRARKQAETWLREVGLEHRTHHFPGEMSGGEQQRVAIARALVTQPAIVLADEPTGNLDSANGALIMDLMHRINRDQGQTFVAVSHDHSFKSVADRVVYMHDGRIAEIERITR